MINYTWKIEQMWVKPAVDTFTDVVITAAWRCNASDGTYQSTAYGTVSFSHPSEPFTPYDQLTEQMVLDWCWASTLDKTATETALAGNIDSQINPPVITPPLPW